ncbi:MAG TPA: Ig-like domain-containing protein, partial [Anaerolineaceae bacterium]|nr:Ig-like domain-containing protein [Anaerolineaceae bacterium]
SPSTDYNLGVVVDHKPAVTAVTPANGATGVAVGANLTVTFDEGVNVADGWYDVSCSSSGTHTAVVSGTGSSRTLNPDSDFAPGESCTATIYAAQVTDTDSYDPPDALAANYSWNFTIASGAGCGSLFISEYVEGSSSNKAIEIYNGTGAAVNLSGYKLEQYNNGSLTPSYTYALSGTLANGDVVVVANDSAGAELLALADLTTNSNMMAFNGDDAIALRTTANVYVDVIGQIGTDPGTRWGASPTSTADNTLRRKGTVSTGDTDGSNAFDPAAEWDGYAQDTFDGLGAHVASCGGGDFAPTVSSTSPANGASGVLVGADLTVNFSENVTVSGSWYNITCSASGAHTAVVSGGPKTFTLNPGTNFTSPESCTATIYAAQVADQDGTINNMASDYTWNFSVGTAAAPCSTIPLIQGTGNASTCTGHRSNVEGCVTGVTANGFYFQDTAGDGNPASSDGIYAYYYGTWTNPNNLQPGDKVRVSGTVSEYYDTTEFAHKGTDALSATKIGTCTVPAAVAIAPITDPAANPMALYEKYEGMRVQMTFDGWVTGPTKRFISRYAYGDPEIAFVDYGSSIPDGSRVFHDTYTGYQGLQYITGGLGFDLPDLDFGDRITGANVTGVLGYQFDKYTLLVDSASGLTTVDNPDVSDVETALDPLKREFSVCFYNVENLFDNIDDSAGDWGDWAPGYPTSGSAAGLAAYQAHLTETAAVLVNGAKACMVIGLEEMEGKQGVYNDLAAKLNAIGGGYTWTAIYVESGDARDISQGFLYRNDVTLVSGPTPVSGAPYTTWVSDSTLDFRRVPASAKFRFFSGTATQTDIIVYGLHFKSKGSSTSCTIADCTDVREKESADLRDILGHHQDAGDYAIAGGDFNDYLNSTPIGILNASAKVQSLFAELPAADQYSYIFNGESEVLDHMYITNTLKPGNGSIWKYTFSPVHVNADFPAGEHASDHDPLRTVFSFYVDNGSGGPGADLTDLPLSYDLAWHKGPHALWLGSGVTYDSIYSVDADAEDADMGVKPLFTIPWKGGNTAQISVTVGGAGNGWLTGWFDWNKDGDYDDAGEKAVNQAVAVGVQTIPVPIPADAQVGAGVNSTIPVRFRLYESAAEPAGRAAEIEGGGQIMAARPSGAATGGEVFDANWGFNPTAVTLTSLQAKPAQAPLWPWLAALGALAAVVWMARKKI